MRQESLPRVDGSLLFFLRDSRSVGTFQMGGKGGWGDCYFRNQAQSFPQLLTQSNLLPGKNNLLSGEIKESLP